MTPPSHSPAASTSGLRDDEQPASAERTAVPGHSPARPPAAAPGGIQGEPAPPPPAKHRDAFFDNAKYLAIVLVALGHAWEPLYAGSRSAAALYIFVYAFHMPAFTVISGYFSRSFEMRRNQLQRLVTGVAVPYIVFQTAYAAFRYWAGDLPDFSVDLTDPWFLTWFLVALFLWRLTAPLWRIVRWPVPLALAIALAASVSPDLGSGLDLQRVLQFLPFFVLGMCLKPEHFRLVRRRAARIAAVPVLVAALAFAYWAVPRMNDAWFYHTDSAQHLGVPWWCGILMQLAMFGCSLVLTACFLAWVPGRRTWCTVLGAGTLYGYLLHGFLAKASRWWDWYDADWIHTPWGALAVTLLAGVIVTLLCTPPVQRALRFVMEPKMTWAFRKEPSPPPGAPQGRTA
ncbi:acyltransferase family protein [Streptomyces sp. DSM 41527]|uniref:Acyltransferase family protein n=1 Tax=Streptomyces mooreae TaxID=3075523 RepID=A0ABU2T192_9ACTN|nr:acyltransferase family protein [Streptomyces sp. DSM 41527]MDT0454852.1 acyltransferase family protein [Streptomyces sp. DSM 41527]